MNGILPSLPAGLAWRGVLTAPGQDETIGGAGAPAPGATQPAEAPPAGTGQQAPPGKQQNFLEGCLQGPFILILAMVVFFYFFLIRPQQRQEKARKALLASLNKNDRVVTSSGIHGKVADLDERTVVLKIDEKGDVRVRFDRSAIATILDRTGGEEPAGRS